MNKTFAFVLITTWLTLGIISRGAPPQSAPAPLLMVSGEVTHPLSLSQEAFAAMPHVQLSVKDRDGKSVTYGGVAVTSILKEAGVPSTLQMRNGAIALALVVEGADGYRAVFSLVEIESRPATNPVLLADSRDGHPLAGAEGPLRLIVPRDPRPVRWVRQAKLFKIARP